MPCSVYLTARKLTFSNGTICSCLMKVIRQPGILWYFLLENCRLCHSKTTIFVKCLTGIALVISEIAKCCLSLKMSFKTVGICSALTDCNRRGMDWFNISYLCFYWVKLYCIWFICARIMLSFFLKLKRRYSKAYFCLPLFTW